MKMTTFEKFYNYLVENPKATNPEICKALDLDNQVCKTYLNRLKVKGLIDTEYEGSMRKIQILKDYPIPKVRPKTFKQAIFTEMVEIYADDFKMCETFEERLKVGREIRILLTNL